MKKAKLTLLEVVNANEGLAVLAKKDMPVISAYRIGSIIKQTESIVKSFQETRLKALKAMGKPNKEGTNYELGKNKPKFDKQMEELVKVQETIEYEPIDLDDLKDVQIDALSMVRINPFIKK